MKKGESTARFPFPLQGVDISVSEEDLQELTAPDLVNVRPYDYEDRSRGGSRPPIRRLLPDGDVQNPTARAVAAGSPLVEEPVQAVAEIVGVEFTGLNETETTNKAIVIVYIVGGYLYRLDWDVEADTKTTTQIGQVGTATDEFSISVEGPIAFIVNHSTVPAYTNALTQTTYHQYFNALDNTLNNWELGTYSAVAAGDSDPDWPNRPLVDPNEPYSEDGNGDDNRTLVSDNSYKGFFPTTETKLVCKWGQRTVLAGFKDDEGNLIASRKGDSFNFDWRPLMRSKYHEENIQIRATNADYTTQVAAYNAKLAAAIGPEPNTQPVFAYTTFTYDGDAIPIAAPNATGDSFNEKTARTTCQSNNNSLKAAQRASNGSFIGTANWQNPDNLMRSATLEAKDVNEYLRDEYPLRYEETTDETELADMAFSLRHSDVGLVPDEIVNLIPYDENILIILCKSSVWELNGGSDLSNARLRPVTDQVGGTAGNSWVVDPARNIYFVGADKGIYQMVLQQPVRRIDLPIEHLTNKFNKFDGRWSLIWDEQEGGIYFHGWDSQNYINLFYSLRTQGWFVDEFGGSTLASQVMVGASLHAKQANEKDTVRLAVWGSKDGELYYVDNEYSGDYRDETTYKALPNTAAIDSFVLFGPMNVKEGDGVGPMDDLRLTKLCFEMVDDSSAIIWGLQAADTASQAREIPARVMGRITHQRLRTSRQRCTGKNIYLHVQSDPSFEEPWSIDNVVMHGEIRSGLKRRT